MDSHHKGEESDERRREEEGVEEGGSEGKEDERGMICITDSCKQLGMICVQHT